MTMTKVAGHSPRLHPKPRAHQPAAAPKARPQAPAAKPKARATAAPEGPASFGASLGLSDQQLAKVLGLPLESARKNLPVIAEALKKTGITSRNAVIGVLATIKTEVDNFHPIHEKGGPKYWRRYNGRKDLGNRKGTNDGVTYHGRGYVQLTGRANYQEYGRKVGVDLAANPDKALQPAVAAEVLANYFQDRDLDDAAKRGDWRGVRKGVNGGLKGWRTFIATVKKLQAASN